MKWSHGRSEIKPRDPTNPAYQSELVQATWFFISTKKDDLAVDHEVRVFRRLQNGEWSIWNTGSYGVWDPDRFDVWNINRCVVTEKITDLTMKVEEPMPSDPTLRSVQEDWKDGNGVGKYLGLTFCMDEKPHWIMRHRVEREGSETVQATTYSKIHGGPREGWPEWLMKGAKAGLQDLKGYFVPV